MGSICYGLVLLAPISLALTLIAHVAVFLVVSPRRKRRSGPTPPITILKPVKGEEEGLYENLASLACQDYPEFEILVGAEDALDPALDVARSVQADHPAARIRIQAGSRRLGLNPKVNLLAALTERARHDHLLVSDSNVRVQPHYLRDTAAEMEDPQVGLVTNLVAGEEGDSLGGALESLQLNSFVASAASFARVVAGRACVIGKSMLFRRDDFEDLGGFWSVRNVLAEDYLIGRAFEMAGFRVALSPHVITTVNRGWTAERFANRHLRWAQMRRRICLPAYLGELPLNPILWIALALCAIASLRRSLDVRLVVLACVAVAVKCASDALVSRRLRGELPPLRHVLLIPFKDLLMAAIWLVGAFRRTVNWRGNLLRIESGSALVALEVDAFEHALQEVA
ncbi:MAG TPA: glycosyltransferase [Myxococcales bacterium]|nr:glycosyltransferase [Myxococcales bacterium]